MLNLTPQERQVVLFLITAALIGIGIDFSLKKYSPTRSIAYFNQDIGKIDLNTADDNLLMEVPGIGEKLAKRIIEYRDKHTGFGSLEELKDVKGITDYKYEKIKDLLCVK